MRKVNHANELFLFQNSSTGKDDVWFTFQKMKYTYEAEEKKRFLPIQFPTDLTFKQYMEWKGYQEDLDLKQAENIFDKNK